MFTAATSGIDVSAEPLVPLAQEQAQTLLSSERIEFLEAEQFVGVVRTLGFGLAPQPALELLGVLREFCDAYGEPNLALAVYVDIGTLHRRGGELDAARQVLELGHSRYESVSFAPMLLLELIEVARAQGRWRDALAQIEAVLSPGTFLETGEAWLVQIHRQTRGLVLFQRALVELGLGRLDAAAESAVLAEQLAEKFGDPVLRLNAFLTRAALDYRAFEFEKVLDALLPVEHEFRASAESVRWQWFVGMTEAALETLDPARPRSAEGRLSACLETGELSAHSAFDATHTLCELALSRADLAGAERWLSAAQHEMERWGASERGRALRSLNLIALRAQALVLGKAPVEELRDALADLDLGIDTMLQSWQDTPDAEGGIGFLELGERRSVVAEFVRLSVLIDGEEAGTRRALERLFSVQQMGSLVRDANLGSIRVEDVQRDLCAAGHGLVVFLPAAPDTHAFSIDGERVVHHTLPSSFGYRRAIDEFVRSTRRRVDAALWAEHERGLRRQAEELADVLLTPELRERMSSWKSVTIVGGDLLHNLPFEALPFGDGSELLGEHMAVAALPSVPVGIWLARRVAAQASVKKTVDLALVATLAPSPAVVERFGLPEALAVERADFADVLAAYDPARTAPFFGSEATRSALESIDLSSTVVTQIAAHGVFDPSRERGAALALSPSGNDSGIVFSEEVERMNFGGLVLLTACGTALGPTRRGGDEVANLGGAFLRAGASAVILTRARVEWRTAQELAGIFHERLTRFGDAPSEALRRARAEIVARDRSKAYELAQIQLLGLGQRPLFEAATGDDPRWVVALIVALGLAAAVGIWRVTRRYCQ